MLNSVIACLGRTRTLYGILCCFWVFLFVIFKWGGARKQYGKLYRIMCFCFLNFKRPLGIAIFTWIHGEDFFPIQHGEKNLIFEYKYGEWEATAVALTLGSGPWRHRARAGCSTPLPPCNSNGSCSSGSELELLCLLSPLPFPSIPCYCLLHCWGGGRRKDELKMIVQKLDSVCGKL